MDTGMHLFMDGNVIVKILFLQAVVAAFVLFLLKKLLDRELFVCLLENISSFPSEQGMFVSEVVVITAGKLPGDDEFRLRLLIRERFPRAEIAAGVDRSIGGGVVVRAGDHVLDFSFWSRIRRLFGFFGV